MHKGGGAAFGLVLATTLALVSVRVQRTGPEQVVYSNLCGPTMDDLCYKPVLKGGFPIAYLFDAPGVSVEDQLAFGEDNVYPGAFAANVVVYFAVIMLGHRTVSRRRSPNAAPTAWRTFFRHR
jgi:hypothetical protein